jgi:SAM-dependent methyltransferase
MQVHENYFDGLIAEAYDADSSEMFEPAVIDATVSFLTGLAGDGKALELAIGTGRIGLPLHQSGVPVSGIDLSPAMVAQLRAKPGGHDIVVEIGDFTSTTIEGPFRLAYLLYNTVENLTSQDDQVECFRNVARHLEPGGFFVIEVEVPQLRRLPPGETVRVFESSPSKLGFDELDVATQQGVSHLHWMADGQRGVFSMPFRYVWPSELDLMARLAGMRLRERWGDWNREPFTSDSRKHISVWEKSA